MNASPELVTRAQAGDRAALEALVNAVQGDVWRLLLSRLGREEDAADATQETFRQALDSLATLREPAAFAGWLFRIALNKARDLRNGREAEARAARASVAIQREAAMPAENAEVQAQVREAVKGLDEDLRSTVELRYEHDLSYAEIAKAMDVPEGTVARRLHTAHERLRQALAGAGVALAMAALERELAAAPRAEMPAELAGKVRALARRHPAAGPARGSSAKRWGFVAAILASLSLFYFFRDPEPKSAAGIPPAIARKTSPASPPRDLPAAEPAAPPEQTASDPAVPPAEAPATIRGTVTAGRGGAGVAGARLEFMRVTGKGGWRTEAQATTDETGAYRVGVPAGTYDIALHARGFPGVVVDITLEDTLAGRSFRINPGLSGPGTVVAAGEERVVDLPLELHLATAVEFRGRILDERGYPVAGAVVTPLRQQMGERDLQGLATFGVNYDIQGEPEFTSLTTDAEGRFVFPCVFPRGNFLYGIAAEGFVPVEKRQHFASQSVDAEIVLQRARRIEGRVVDADGQPVKGARILAAGLPPEPGSVMRMDGRGPDERSIEPAGPATDSEGKFVTGPLGTGVRALVAVSEGKGWALAALSADASEVEIRLPRANLAFRGVVRDPAGAPIAGARVQILRVWLEDAGITATLAYDFHGPGPRGSGPEPEADYHGTLSADQEIAAETDAEGRFTIPNLQAGRFRLLIRAAGFEPKAEAIEAPGEGILTLDRQDTPVERR